MRQQLYTRIQRDLLLSQLRRCGTVTVLELNCLAVSHREPF